MAPVKTPPQPRLAQTSDYAVQYRPIDSPIHRLGAGWKMLLGMALCAAALGAREPWSLALMFAINAGYYFLARLSLADLLRDIWFFLIQLAVVIILYCMRYGIPEGIWPGVRTCLQILLFFIPGIIFLRTTQVSQMMYGMRKIMPYKLSFLVFTSLRFIPFFARETREIATAQRLRGARLAPRELINPRNWGDLLYCLILPLIIRALKTANEAALSAEARGFGTHKKRTYWNPRKTETAENNVSSAPVKGKEIII
jgi:energy-coupling factor transport system permease protein